MAVSERLSPGEELGSTEGRNRNVEESTHTRGGSGSISTTERTERSETEISSIEERFKKIDTIQKKSLPERLYMNDFHKKSSEASLKEVQYMLEHPFSLEEALRQTKTKTNETNVEKRKFKNLPKE